MGNNEYIAPETERKLAEVFPKGTRHKAAIDIAIPLIGGGLPDAAVFATLRSKFETDMPDKELHDIVNWARSRNPEPPGGNGNGNGHRDYSAAKPAPKQKAKTPLEYAEWWTSGERLTPDGTVNISPVRLPNDPTQMAIMTVSCLYRENENLNIVCKHLVDGEKAKPFGGGKVMTSRAWANYFNQKGCPHSEAGAWMRINPCSPVGTGKDAAITDADVTAFRYCLVESDVLPIAVQLALYARLPIPIVAILMSGGLSAHAWVRIDSPNGDTFERIVKRLFLILKPFGIDSANSNPSRLSRLPGAVRVIGAVDGGLQRLLWLSPNSKTLTDDDLDRLEEAIKFPAIEDRPLRKLASDAAPRYEEMRRLAGKVGVPTGIPRFDQISGGMKPGQTYVVAGQTGGGKTTLALHIILSALNSGTGVALFSLEMDREEMFDMLVSNHCGINRNKFNTGRFDDDDLQTIPVSLLHIQKLPLYIEDSSTAGVDQIRGRTLQLKAAGKIGLVVVDYIQFVNAGFTRESREQQIAGISHSLRTIARETKLPMVVLSQLNDEGRLRESRVIAHNANVVMIVEVEKDTVTVNVIKGRSIPCESYGFDFNRTLCRLEPRPFHETPVRPTKATAPDP